MITIFIKRKDVTVKMHISIFPPRWGAPKICFPNFIILSLFPVSLEIRPFPPCSTEINVPQNPWEGLKAVTCRPTGDCVCVPWSEIAVAHNT